MPELPAATRQRLLGRGLSERDVDFLMSIDEGREVGSDGQIGSGFVSYFDAVAKDRDPKAAINWCVHGICPRSCCLFDIVYLGSHMTSTDFSLHERRPSERTLFLSSSFVTS